MRKTDGEACLVQGGARECVEEGHPSGTLNFVPLPSEKGTAAKVLRTFT